MRGGPPPVRSVLGAPLTARARAELAHCLLGFPLALAGFLPVAAFLALGAGLTVSLLGAVLGLLLIVTAIGLARALSGVHRRLAAALLGERVPAPARPRPRGGAFARLDARLRDAAGRRSVAYVLVKLPVAAFGMYAAGWWLAGLIDLATPLRWAAFGQRDMPTITPVPIGAEPRTAPPSPAPSSRPPPGRSSC